MAEAYAVFAILGVVLVAVWIFLPFAIFGTQPILKDILSEIRETNQLLRSIKGTTTRAKTIGRSDNYG